MSDPGFREIHLSGKHVVFLFMAGAVAFVGIFLLGVSVGRGVTKADASTAQVSPSPTSAATDPGASPMPDSTRPRPGELQATPSMQEKGTPKPTPSPDASAAPVFSPSPSPSPAKPTTATANAKPAATAPWFVVVASFSSRANADNQVAELKKKGYTATVVTTATGSKTPYRVRIGPLDDRPAADALKARLTKEGFKPSVTR